jgi:hypothetical protein
MKKILEELDNTYRTEVALTVDVKGLPNNDVSDVGYDEKIMLTYEIDIDYKSWGIDGIHFRFPKPITFDVWTYEWNEEDYKDVETMRKTITIPLTDAEVESTSEGILAPTDINVYLKSDFTLDHVEIEVSQLHASYIGK